MTPSSARHPSVSVIVPVYNARGVIGRLIGSLQRQEYPAERTEIILVDNGSTDGTREVMMRHAAAGPGTAARRPRIRCLSETARQGSYAARNTGIRRAEGEVLAFVDADCWADPAWLREGVGRLLQGRLDRVAGVVRFATSRRPNICEIYDSVIEFRQDEYAADGWSGAGNLFARRGLFDEIGLWDEELISGGDYEFGVRATKQGKSLAVCDRAVVFHEARTSFASIFKKNVRTGYGCGQLWRRHGYFGTSLFYKKANYRPYPGAWRDFPDAVQASPRMRAAIDAIAYSLRLASNLGNMLGYFDLLDKFGLRRRLR